MSPEILIDSIRIGRPCEYWATGWYHHYIILKRISVSFRKLKFNLDAHTACCEKDTAKKYRAIQKPFALGFIW